MLNEAEFIKYKFTWVTRSIVYLSSKTGLNPLISSVVLYGSFAIILGIVSLIRGLSALQILERPDVYLPAILAYTWIAYGPSLIHYFEVRGKEDLKKGLENVLLDREAVNDLLVWYFNSVRRKFILVSLPLVTLALICAVVMVDYAILYFNVKGLFDLFYVFAVSVMLLIVYMGGIGFTAVFYNVKLTKRLSKINIKLDPFHPDEFGGMMTLGQFSIKITLLFSSGAVLLPFLIKVGSYLGDVAFLLSVLISSIYILFVVLSFLVPTLNLHAIAVREKQRHLDMIKRHYKDIYDSVVGRLNDDALYAKAEESIHPTMRMIFIGECCRIIEKMKVYPIDMEIILQLLGSIALPIILTFIQILLLE